MAVVTVKSVNITNQDAAPRVATQSGIGGTGRLVEQDDFVTVTNGDSAASKYLFIRLPTTIRVKSIWVENAALGGACAANLGVYYPDIAQDAGGQVLSTLLGTAVSASLFASAVSLVGAAAPAVNLVSQSGTYPMANRSQPLWQAAGLASDPGGKLDIVLALTAAAAATGNVYVKIHYTE